MTHGAWLVDARPIHAWARRHPHGAVSIELRPAFASWLGWVIPFGAPIVLLVDEADRADAVRLARRIGYDRLLGWIDGGIDAWTAADLPDTMHRRDRRARSPPSDRERRDACRRPPNR